MYLNVYIHTAFRSFEMKLEHISPLTTHDTSVTLTAPTATTLYRNSHTQAAKLPLQITEKGQSLQVQRESAEASRSHT